LEETLYINSSLYAVNVHQIQGDQAKYLCFIAIFAKCAKEEKNAELKMKLWP